LGSVSYSACIPAVAEVHEGAGWFEKMRLARARNFQFLQTVEDAFDEVHSSLASEAPDVGHLEPLV
jgi:hypothetical protein